MSQFNRLIKLLVKELNTIKVRRRLIRFTGLFCLVALIVSLAIFPIGSVPLIRQPFWSPDVALVVEEVNAYLDSLKAKNVLILDAYSLLVEDQQVKHQYVYDTLHINRRGYKALNQELKKMLSTGLIDIHKL